jgi:hypothetical protein
MNNMSDKDFSKHANTEPTEEEVNSKDEIEPYKPHRDHSGFRESKYDGEVGAHLEHNDSGTPAGGSHIVHHNNPPREHND